MKTRSYQLERHNDVIVVSFLRETLDPASIDDLHHEVMDLAKEGPEGQKIIVDLSAIAFMPSRFIGVMADVHRAAGQKKGQLRIAGLRPAIRSVFSLMRLDTLIPIHATRDEAIAAFTSQPAQA